MLQRALCFCCCRRAKKTLRRVGGACDLRAIPRALPLEKPRRAPAHCYRSETPCSTTCRDISLNLPLKQETGCAYPGTPWRLGSSPSGFHCKISLGILRLQWLVRDFARPTTSNQILPACWSSPCLPFDLSQTELHGC